MLLLEKQNEIQNFLLQKFRRRLHLTNQFLLQNAHSKKFKISKPSNTPNCKQDFVIFRPPSSPPSILVRPWNLLGIPLGSPPLSADPPLPHRRINRLYQFLPTILRRNHNTRRHHIK
jgi:hypothetical protein